MAAGLKCRRERNNLLRHGSMKKHEVEGEELPARCQGCL